MANHISRRRFVRVLIGTSSASIALALSACGGGSTPAPTVAAPAAGSGGAVSLSIGSKASTPFFDNEKLEAKAGSKITLTLKNNADPASNRQFNWVLVKPGTMLRVVSDGQSDGSADTSYVKPSDDNVIVHTKLVKPGESDTITFDAPPSGQYPFISTFPGYYNTMKGVLTIQ